MNDESNGFFRFTFKCTGFPVEEISDEENEAAKPEADDLRNRFWKRTVFREQRELEREKKLYIKALFIISSRGPSLSEVWGQEYLKMLVCDQITLFKDTDPAFRGGQINRENNLTKNKYNQIQNYKKYAKERCLNYVSKELDRKLEWHINYLVQEGQDSERELLQIEKNLLQAVVQRATEQEKSSVYAWLFSDRHIEITEDNIDDYKEHYLKWRKQSDPTDKKTEEEAVAAFLENKSAMKRLVTRYKENKNPYEYWMLDLHSCIKDFHTICEESKRLITTTEQCEWFIREVLALYISSYTVQTEAPFQKPSQYRSLNLGVRSFKKRTERLEKLEYKFLSDKEAEEHLIVREEETCWGIDASLEDTPKQHIVEQLAEQISQFFQLLYPDREFPPTKNPTLLYLQRRIAWVIQNRKKIQQQPSETAQQKTEIPDMTPMLLLSMVLQLKYTVWEDLGASEFDSDKEQITNKNLIHSDFFPRIDYVKQRLLQISLLKQMSDTLNLSVKDQMENYREFLLRCGIEILSREETLLWRKILHKKYELLPLIGFQLCYINYARESVPYHLETLACKASSCWRTKYHGYYITHKKELKRDALNNKERYQDAKKEYEKLWKDASTSTEKMLGFLEQECKKINDTESMTTEEQEYQCPILETKLRMLLREEAIQKLFDSFCKAYSYSLHNALTYQCNLKSSQGEIPTKREESIPPH